MDNVFANSGRHGRIGMLLEVPSKNSPLTSSPQYPVFHQVTDFLHLVVGIHPTSPRSLPVSIDEQSVLEIHKSQSQPKELPHSPLHSSRHS